MRTFQTLRKSGVGTVSGWAFLTEGSTSSSAGELLVYEGHRASYEPKLCPKQTQRKHNMFLSSSTHCEDGFHDQLYYAWNLYQDRNRTITCRSCVRHVQSFLLWAWSLTNRNLRPPLSGEGSSSIYDLPCDRKPHHSHPAWRSQKRTRLGFYQKSH